MPSFGPVVQYLLQTLFSHYHLYEEPLNRIFRFLRYTVVTPAALVLFIGSCILCTTDLKPIPAKGVPLPAAAGIVFSIAPAIFPIRKLK